MKEAVYQAVMAGLNVRCTFRSPIVCAAVA